MYQDPCTSCLSFSNWSFALNRRRGDAHRPDRKSERLINTAEQGSEILLSCPTFSNPAWAAAAGFHPQYLQVCAEKRTVLLSTSLAWQVVAGCSGQKLSLNLAPCLFLNPVQLLPLRKQALPNMKQVEMGKLLQSPKRTSL